MLPRTWILPARYLAMLGLLASALVVAGPADAITKYTPPVTIQELRPSFVVTQSTSSMKTLQVVSKETTTPFSVIGLTWLGAIEPDTTFKVKVREFGIWSSWYPLLYSSDHGVDEDSLEALNARQGTDPFMSAPATAVQITMSNKSGIAPNDLQVSLIGSNETIQDRALVSSVRLAVALPTLANAAVSPSGAIVPRPNIVTRAQWGANEAWRDPVPKMGTKILAGFVHHTATTNNYSPAQAPAQMRSLYAYFTKSLHYADMGYNFLVDQYGTVYEGRNGCVYKSTDPCDGPTLPAQGAHTAGMNINTFAISAIGNYDTKKPSHPAAMVEAIASLMAWKIAPYGLDPNANAQIVSLDTTGRSKYSKGQTAITPVISGHRDVGRTACPGRYLYPYLPAIRARATELLAPKIYDVAITPVAVDIGGSDPITVSAIVPTAATWSISVADSVTGVVLQSVTSPDPTPTPTPTPTVTPPATSISPTQKISYIWDRTDAIGAQVAAGRYLIRITATYGTKKLPTTKSTIFIGKKPLAAKGIKFKKLTKSKALITWTNPAGILPLTSQLYRYSKDGGKTWSAWTATTKGIAGFTYKKLKLGARYEVQVKVKNALGISPITTFKFKQH